MALHIRIQHREWTGNEPNLPQECYQIYHRDGPVSRTFEIARTEVTTREQGMEFEEDGTRNWVPQEEGCSAFPFTDDLVVDIIYQVHCDACGTHYNACWTHFDACWTHFDACWGTSLRRNCTPLQDHRRALGIVLL